jgi:hypothetical protein
MYRWPYIIRKNGEEARQERESAMGLIGILYK